MNENVLESVPNTFPSLFWAYAVVWGLLSLYIVYLGIRVGRLSKEIENKK